MTAEGISNLNRFAADVATFLNALYDIDTAGGPQADRENRRGGPLTALDEWARTAIARCEGEVDVSAVIDAWEQPVTVAPPERAVWLHGDIAPSNLLVVDGALSAVIDFGCLAVGDPACDLMIAWTFFDRRSRAVFRDALNLDDATWARARGWALWKAALVLQDQIEESHTQPTWHRMGWSRDATAVIEEVLREGGP